MASLSLTVGVPVAVVDGGKDDKKLLYMDAEYPGDDPINEINLRDNGVFSPLPGVQEHMIDRVFISGATGCGKSTFASSYLKMYKRLNPKRRIVIFSILNDDERSGLDDLGAERIKVDSSLLETEYPITIDDLEGCVVLFDDVDMCTDEKVSKFILKLIEQIIQTGRHHSIDIIYCNHIINNYRKTKNIIQESNKVVIFPKGGDFKGIKDLLETKMGFKKEFIRKVFMSGSRWVLINKEYPVYCLTEFGCFIPKTEYN